MSKPHPQGAPKVLELVRAITDLREEEAVLRESVKRYKVVVAEHRDKDIELCNLLESMDCDISWLLAEVVRHSPEELEKKKTNILDGDQIAAMVVYLGLRRSYPESHKIHPLKKSEHFYTCRNLASNGDCAVYNLRPTMCRDYPYNGTCGYTGCTST